MIASQALALNTTPTVVAVQSQRKLLDHMVVLNPNSTTVYLRISSSEAADGSDPTLFDIIPLGANFSGTILTGCVCPASASITASTASDGTGAPASDVQASLRWDRAKT